MASRTLEPVVKQYRTLASIPALVSAQVSNKGSALISVWSQRNLERGKVTKFARTHFLMNLKSVENLTPIDVTNESLSSISPFEKYKAIIREIDDKDGHKQHLEIWSKSNLSRCVDLSGQKLHGDVYTDVEFGVLKWSSDESKILYVAEKKEKKSDPFYITKNADSKLNISDDQEPTKGEQYLFEQDWGEQLVNKKQSVIVQYDLNTDTFQVLTGIPDAICPAQPTWSPDGSYVVGVGYYTNPRKLGLIYCTNRPSVIFTLDSESNYKEISAQSKSVKSPIFSPDGKTLLWLQRDCNGPHHTCLELVKVVVTNNIVNTKQESVVEIVETEKDIDGRHKFYGLYNTSFVDRCWASDGRLLFTTPQKNSLNSYVLDIESGCISELEYSAGSQVILDVYDDIVLVNRRNYLISDTLALAKLPPKGLESAIVFEEISKGNPISGLENYTYNYLDLKHNSTDVVDTFNAIYVGPKDGKDKQYPLIVWPHGGPHSSFSNNLLLEAAFFNTLGLPVLFINYRGSTGQGKNSVDFLLGKIGQSDVADCVLATDEALAKYPWLDSDRVGLVGGSHGGFLVTHLSGQFPDKFKVVVARNPVIDVAIQSITSDIPDWSFVECGFSYTQKGPLDNQQFLKMRESSPIIHSHKVKAPTLLQVGSKDLRVPPSQALEYYHRLNANGITVKMNLYEDNHPLGSVPNEIDNLINSFLWLEEYLLKQTN